MRVSHSINNQSKRADYEIYIERERFVREMLEDEVDNEGDVETFVVSGDYYTVLVLLLLLLHFYIKTKP